MTADNPDEQSSPKSSRSLRGFFFGDHLPLEAETTRFILVNTLDIFMTYLALRYTAEGRTSAIIGEGNPVGDYFIKGWGIKGMVYFKMFMVGVVVFLAQLIARKSPKKAQLLLNFGTAVVACVVVYSLTLVVRVWK